MKSNDNNICPKCKGKLSPLYFKQNCPHCGVNLVYYNLEQRLAQDAENAAEEVAAVRSFLDGIKNSSVASPILIVRLVTFFTPLLSMLLPMYTLHNGKQFSLLIFIKSLIDSTLSFGDIFKEISSALAFIAICLVVLLSLAVIISSLFSTGKSSLKRNLVFSAINTAVFVGLSAVQSVYGGGLLIGFYLTLAIYVAEIILHVLADRKIAADKENEDEQ